MSASIETQDNTLIDRTAKQLLDRFQKRLDPPSAVFDFALMLNGTESHWPKALLKQAIEATVDGVLRYPASDRDKEFEAIYTTADATAKAHGLIEMGLLRIAALVKRVAPELWAKVLADYPSLSTGPTTVGQWDGKMHFCINGCDSAPGNPRDDKQQALEEIFRLSLEDPDNVAKAISTITDPAIRTQAYVIAAQETASRNPAMSAEFASEARKALAIANDLEMQFQLACARLQSDAVNNNRAAMAEDLDAAFQLADKTMRKRRDDGKDTHSLVFPLSDAVRYAIKIEPELTVAHIEMIYLPFEKANVLSAAAATLAESVPIEKKPASPDATTADKHAK